MYKLSGMRVGYAEDSEVLFNIAEVMSMGTMVIDNKTGDCLWRQNDVYASGYTDIPYERLNCGYRYVGYMYLHNGVVETKSINGTCNFLNFMHGIYSLVQTGEIDPPADDNTSCRKPVTYVPYFLLPKSSGYYCSDLAVGYESKELLDEVIGLLSKSTVIAVSYQGNSEYGYIIADCDSPPPYSVPHPVVCSACFTLSGGRNVLGAFFGGVYTTLNLPLIEALEAIVTMRQEDLVGVKSPGGKDV